MKVVCRVFVLVFEAFVYLLEYRVVRLEFRHDVLHFLYKFQAATVVDTLAESFQVFKHIVVLGWQWWFRGR